MDWHLMLANAFLVEHVSTSLSFSIRQKKKSLGKDIFLLAEINEILLELQCNFGINDILWKNSAQVVCALNNTDTHTHTHI